MWERMGGGDGKGLATRGPAGLPVSGTVGIKRGKPLRGPSSSLLRVKEWCRVSVKAQTPKRLW